MFSNWVARLKLKILDHEYLRREDQVEQQRAPQVILQELFEAKLFVASGEGYPDFPADTSQFSSLHETKVRLSSVSTLEACFRC